MPIYNAPIEDIKFVLHEVLGAESLTKIPDFAEATPDLVDQILEEGAKMCEEVLFPINQSGDEEGCTWKDGEVTTPKGFKEAYDAFTQAGWCGVSADPEFGGMGLPALVNTVMQEMICSANFSFGMYPGLSQGAYEALHHFGTQEQKETYLPKLVTGEWSGTMCLTEPHCGTDLGLIKTRAVPNDDGSYNITGTKIFISAGEHDLSENIIHLVLAKLPDASDDVKGISLFVVPKFTPEDMKRNGIMFIMMNAARLGVAMQGLGIAEVAYQNGLAYAKDRLQMRALSGTKAPEKPADPIIVHPDVRRMLLTSKAFCEGARALSYWTGMNLDISLHHEDEAERKKADDLVQLLTPIVKAYQTDMGFEISSLAMQIHGGHGYIWEYGVEQYTRDARIAMIYEGTNGIQALDLVGRKMGQHMGRYLRRFFHPVQEYIEANQANADLQEFIFPLAKSFAKLQQATAMVAQKGLKHLVKAIKRFMKLKLKLRSSFSPVCSPKQISVSRL